MGRAVLNVTVPVGVPPPDSGATAVKVTLVPTTEGFSALETVVVVGCAAADTVM